MSIEGTSVTEYYKKILCLIPREPQLDVSDGLTVEESNAVQWANAYYHQLKSPPEEVVAADPNQSIESLCQQIQDLVCVIDPDDSTDEFKAIYGTNPEMCRTYNYFNKKIREMLKGPLTRAKTVEPIETIDPIDPVMLDQLARAIYYDSNT